MPLLLLVLDRPLNELLLARAQLLEVIEEPPKLDPKVDFLLSVRGANLNRFVAGLVDGSLVMVVVAGSSLDASSSSLPSESSFSLAVDEASLIRRTLGLSLAASWLAELNRLFTSVEDSLLSKRNFGFASFGGCCSTL